MSDHGWCLDQARDIAVRAAEDGRSGPLPTLEECIGMLAKTGSATSAVEHENKGNDMATKSEIQLSDYLAEASERAAPKGLRTEIDLPPTPEPSPARVTLEFSGRLRAPPSQWPWELILSGACVVRIEPGESVRVVDERAELITQALTADRFAAAIAEADTLRAELSAGKRWRDIVSLDRNAIRADRDALKDRVAELESQLESVAGRAAEPEVVRPRANRAAAPTYVEIVEDRDGQWLAALAAAGVPVKEVGRE